MKQRVDVITKVRNGAVVHVWKSLIEHPVIKFNGKGIKWYEDKRRK